MSREIFPGWTPVQIAHHYGFPMSATGAGQTIGVIDLGESLDLEEVRKDFKYLRAAYPDIEVVQIDAPPPQPGVALETHLDIEVLGCICPDAKIKVYRSALTLDGMAAAITRAVKDDVDVISISWGGSESTSFPAIDKALEAAKAANITVCVATGDFGSSQAANYTHQPVAASDGLAHRGHPASSPLVLACGGTQMMVDANGARTEIVWNNTNIGKGATGGGVSILYDVPKWQADAGIDITSANPGAKVGRVIPDVAGLAAGNDWKIGTSGGEKYLTGGTSAVAPLWAAFIALVNETRLNAGKTRLGFLNQRLYAMANKTDCFTDITDGDNKTTPTYPGYEAKAGFDACSGWGVPKGAALAKALTNWA